MQCIKQMDVWNMADSVETKLFVQPEICTWQHQPDMQRIMQIKIINWDIILPMCIQYDINKSRATGSITFCIMRINSQVTNRFRTAEQMYYWIVMEHQQLGIYCPSRLTARKKPTVLCGAASNNSSFAEDDNRNGNTLAGNAVLMLQNGRRWCSRKSAGDNAAENQRTMMLSDNDQC